MPNSVPNPVTADVMPAKVETAPFVGSVPGVPIAAPVASGLRIRLAAPGGLIDAASVANAAAPGS